MWFLSCFACLYAICAKYLFSSNKYSGCSSIWVAREKFACDLFLLSVRGSCFDGDIARHCKELVEWLWLTSRLKGVLKITIEILVSRHELPHCKLGILSNWYDDGRARLRLLVGSRISLSKSENLSFCSNLGCYACTLARFLGSSLTVILFHIFFVSWSSKFFPMYIFEVICLVFRFYLDAIGASQFAASLPSRESLWFLPRTRLPTLSSHFMNLALCCIVILYFTEASQRVAQDRISSGW